MNRVGLLLVPLLLALPVVGIQVAHADDLAVVQQAPASIAGVVVDATTLQPLSGAPSAWSTRTSETFISSRIASAIERRCVVERPLQTRK